MYQISTGNVYAQGNNFYMYKCWGDGVGNYKLRSRKVTNALVISNQNVHRLKFTYSFISHHFH